MDHEIELLNKSAVELFDALIISGVNLLFPLTVIAKTYFLHVTGRHSPKFYDMDFGVNLMLFGLTVLWILDEYRLGYPIEGNHYIDMMGDRELEHGSIMMVNMIYCIDTNGYRFDFILSAIAGLTWLKTIL